MTNRHRRPRSRPLVVGLLAALLLIASGCREPAHILPDDRSGTLLTDEWARSDRWIEEYGEVEAARDPRVERAKSLFEKLRRIFDGAGSRLIVLGSDLASLEIPIPAYAAALPDGNVVITRAALELCYSGRSTDEGDARLAFLLSHELAHFQLDHHRFLEAAAIALSFEERDEVDEQLEEILATSTDELRQLELSADEAGLLGMIRAGYDSQAVLGGDQTFFDAWVSTIANQVAYEDDSHPDPETRARFALRSLQRAAAKAPLFHRGVDAMKAHDYQAAVDAFEELKLAFPSREVLSNLGLAYYQIAAHQLARCDGSLVTLWRAPVALDEETLLDRIVWRGSEQSHCYHDDPFYTTRARAQEALEAAHRIDESYAPATINLVALYLLDGKSDFAAAYANQGVGVHPDNRDLRVAQATAEAANAFEAERNTGPAAEVLERLHAEFPEDADIAFNAAQAYWLAGDYDRAEALRRDFLHLEPTGEWADLVRGYLPEDDPAAQPPDQPAK